MNHWAANSNLPFTWQQQQAPPPVTHVNNSSSASASNSIHQFHELPNSRANVNPFTRDVAEDRAAAAVSRSHCQAEKRRRDRINAQLATLRKLIPNSDKMDKAALLGSVIEHVKELKLKAMEVNKTLTIPTEVDEVTVDYYEFSKAAAEAEETSINNKSKGDVLFFKASVSCDDDDQPELFKEIMRVIKGLSLTIMRAEFSSVGGRIKSILVLCNKDACVVHQDIASSLSKSLKQALHLALSRMPASSSSMGSNCRIRSKRQRFFLPSHN